jgi:hypothetical protein
MLPSKQGVVAGFALGVGVNVRGFGGRRSLVFASECELVFATDRSLCRGATTAFISDEETISKENYGTRQIRRTYNHH